MRLREALNDSSESPRFIETLPRRGYRFVAPVEEKSASENDSTQAQTGEVSVPQSAIAKNGPTLPPLSPGLPATPAKAGGRFPPPPLVSSPLSLLATTLTLRI